MATTVKITETYDLKTTVNRMGLIGIHTPSSAQIQNMYPGLMKNHKFIRFVKCDVAGACASILPVDPLSVGVSAGNVAPEDMFNPILYKAVTNDSFDTLVNKVYGSAHAGALGSVSKEDLDASLDSFKVYYSLLAENGRFKKSMPQSGFMIRNLVPICHTLISQYGNVAPIGTENVLSEDGETPVIIPDIDGVNVTDASPSTATRTSKALVFRGKSLKMPKIPLHYRPETLSGVPSVNIPETFVCALVIPPAKLHEFYYRMRVTWTIRFENVMSALEVAGTAGMTSIASAGYYKGYEFSKSESELSEKTTSVDADGVSIEKIMES